MALNRVKKRLVACQLKAAVKSLSRPPGNPLVIEVDAREAEGNLECTFPPGAVAKRHVRE
jgi:hypothetical protein